MTKGTDIPGANEAQSRFFRHRLIGIFLGPAIALVIFLTPAPDGLSQPGWSIAAVGLWMAVWWMTETLPLAATAMLPLLLFPVLGVSNIETTASAYAHPLIFLFLGGFLLARAMNVWGLDARLALTVLSAAGSNPRKVIAAVMAVTAFLSMWVSNTATAMVMLPIGLSIAATFGGQQRTDAQSIAPALLLSIAYAATIGGIATLIGTPPNALFAAYMAEAHGIEIGFFKWMTIGLPLVLVLLPITWFVLTRFAFHVASEHSPRTAEVIKQKRNALAAMSRAEYTLTILMSAVVSCWLLNPILNAFLPWLRLSDTGIAMMGALLLFLLPVDFKRGRFLLTWEEAAAIRWDVLILFGGGLALATAVGASDLDGWLGAQLAQLRALPLFLLLLAVGALIVFVGELASNTAMAAVFLPIAGASAVAMGEPALVLTLPVALFATLGFMLPVATPPNAVIFGSGILHVRHMLRAGALLDVIGIVIVSVAIISFGEWALG